MKLQVEGVSELVLEVQSMERAVSFWSGKLGFPVVDQWSYKDGQFETSGSGIIWATWLYIGGNTRLGLWLPRHFTEDQQRVKQSPISQWQKGLYDEGGSHVHFALYIQPGLFDETVAALRALEIDILESARTPPACSSVYFKDPEGIIVEFYTRNMKESYGGPLEQRII